MANYEQLFLLEVLVDKVKLLTRALEAFAPECEDEPDTPVRIRVKFSDFPCFEITQDLAPPIKEQRESSALTTPITFSSGKSCLFPMDPEQLIQDLIKYPMAVTVFKKNPDSPIPEIIGQTKVPLGDYMSNIIQRASEWALEEPLSEMIQDTFPLRNAQDQDVGTINMLIRLTCFGKTIITKFQIADNKKSFLFKNAKTQDYEFKCKKCMPGQPILRPRPGYGEEGEDEEEAEWEGDGPCMDEKPSPCVDKEQMTDPYRNPCKGERPDRSDRTDRTDRNQQRESYESGPPPYQTMQGPGFQRHELQGPGFIGSLEVSYPEDQGEYRQSEGKSGLMESQSAPTVKKETSGKSKRGKSLDSKKQDIENGIQLGTTNRKKRTKFHVPKGIAYPGIILGHKYCAAQGPPVPAKNGWAWKTTVPIGMKSEDMRGWRPGAYNKATWATIQKMEELRKMGKPKKIKRKPLLPDTRKTTVHIHRIKGIYHVTMNPVKGPDDKEDPEPVVYTLENSEDGSDASEIEMDLTVPDPPYPPPPELRHQAQQFCEEDLPLIQPKPVFIKKKKKRGRSTMDVANARKKKPGSAKSGKSDKKTSTSASEKQRPGKGPKDKKDKKADDKDSDKKKGKPTGKASPVSGKHARAGSGKSAGGREPPGRAVTGKDSGRSPPTAKEPPGRKGTNTSRSIPAGKAVTAGKGTPAGKSTPGGKGSLPGKGGPSGKAIKMESGNAGKPERNSKWDPAKMSRVEGSLKGDGGKISKFERGGKPDGSKMSRVDGGARAEGSKTSRRDSGSREARARKKGKGKVKGDDDDDVYPWDEWIMKLKCKNKHTPED